MTRPRIALYSLGLIFFVLTSASYYYYQKFPLIAEALAKQYLHAYGVQTLHYKRLKVSHEQLRTDSLLLSGEYEGLLYQANITSMVIAYDWRRLLSGEIQSIKLGSIELSLTETASPAKASTSTTINLAEYLPRTTLNALPVESVDIEHWQIGYNPEAGPKITANGHLQLSDQVQLQVQAVRLGSHLTANIVTTGAEAYPSVTMQMYDSSKHLVGLDITLRSRDSTAWQWDIQGELNYAPILTWLQKQTSSPESPVEPSATKNLQLVGSSQFIAHLSHPGLLKLPDSATAFDYSSFEFEAKTQNVITELSSSASPNKVSGNLPLDVRLSAGEFNFTLGAAELRGQLDTEALSLPTETQQWLGWPESVQVLWNNPGEGLIESKMDDSWAFRLAQNKLVIGNSNSELRWENLDLDSTFGASDELHVWANLKTRLNARLRKKRLPSIDLTLNLDGPLSQNQIQLAFGDVAESLRATLQGEINLHQGHGSFQTSLSSQDLAYASETFLPLLEDLALLKKGLGIKLASGSMSLNSQIDSTGFEVANIKQQSELKIIDVGGQYDEYQFEGVTLDAQWSGTEQWQTHKPIEFSMDRFNMGFDLFDTHALLSLSKARVFNSPKIGVDAFSSGLFGGKIYLPEAQEWDFAAKINRFTLRAEEWRLADMAAMQQGQDIQAKGTLEGALPVTVTEGRIIIADGYLRALAPGGTIRYIANESGRALAASSPELGMALDLLSDFQYETLSSQVKLDEKGNLSLGLSLAGKNLELFEGRAVNFNINLEQNLDPLLQSLRLSDKLIEKLESRSN